jgi:hypothetical protein
MKHLLLAGLLVAASLIGYSQCDKKVLLTSSKTDHLGADSSVQRSVDENTIVEFDRATFSVAPGDNPKMTGKVNSITCSWSTPYKVGRTQMKVTLTNPEGESKDATITIENKAGKIVMLAVLDSEPDKKIRLVADKFEEKQ